jgi:hypothetical protein
MTVLFTATSVHSSLKGRQQRKVETLRLELVRPLVPRGDWQAPYEAGPPIAPLQ